MRRSGVQLGVGVVTGVLAGVEVLGGVKVASRSRAVNCRSACEHRVVEVHVAYTIDPKKI